VVLGGHHHIFHAGFPGGFCPGSGIKVFGSKAFKERQIFRLRHLLITADPFTPAGDAVKTPVDKHSEPGPAEPIRPLFVCVCVETVHSDSSHRFLVAIITPVNGFFISQRGFSDSFSSGNGEC
jgi:hypothetical protein